MSTTSLEQARVLKEKAMELYRRGEYPGAAASLTEARALFQAQGARREEAEALNNLGVVHLLLEHWGEAAQALEQARVAFVELEDLGGQGEALGNLGVLYRRRGDAEGAVATLKDAADLLQRAGKWEAAMHTYRAAARIRLGQGRILEFLHFYDLSLACFDKPSWGNRLLRKLIQIPLGLLTRRAA